MQLVALLPAVILGLIEGATEFIPVSSTGHLIIASAWLNFSGERAKTFDVFIQLGAILAIVWLYRHRLLAAAVDARHQGPGRRFVANLAIAFLPAALVGVLAHDWIKEYLFTPLTVSIALVIGGVAILAIERWHRSTRIEDIDQLPAGTALGIGIAQVLSLIPGTSRSGATIMGAYGLGLSRKTATEFSFFLAIPVMLAATVFDLLKSWEVLRLSDIPIFAVGFLVSFVSALVIVRAFLAYVSHNSFAAFAWYRIAFGAVLFLWYRSHGVA